MAPQEENYDDDDRSNCYSSDNESMKENLVDDITQCGLVYTKGGEKVTSVGSKGVENLGREVREAVLNKLLSVHGPLERDEKWGFSLLKDSKYQKFLEDKRAKKSDCGILVIGPSQHGKSTLINFILKGERVKKGESPESFVDVGFGNESCTKECTVCTSNYNGMKRDLSSHVIKYDIIDTPGLLDSSSDNDFLNALSIYDTLQALKGKTKLSCVVLAIKYDTNITKDLIESLKTYQLLLGEDMFEETLCVVFTKTSFSPEAMEELQYDNVDRAKVMLKSLQILKSGLGLRNDPRHFALNSKPSHKDDILVALQVRQFILDLAHQTQPFQNLEPRIAKTKEMIADDKMKILEIEGERRGYITSFEDSEAELTGSKSILSLQTKEISAKEKYLGELAEILGKLAGDREAVVTQERIKPENINPWRAAWPWKKAVIRVEANVEIHDFQHLNCYPDDENSNTNRNTGTAVVYSRFMRTFKYSEISVRAKKVIYYSEQIASLRERKARAEEQLTRLNNDRESELRRMGLSTSTNTRLREKIKTADAELERLRSPYLTPEEAVSKVPNERQRRKLHRKEYKCKRVNLM